MPGECITVAQLCITRAHESLIILSVYINLTGSHLAIDVYLAVGFVYAMHVCITEGDGITIHIHAGRHGIGSALFVPAGVLGRAICTPYIAQHQRAVVVTAGAGIFRFTTPYISISGIHRHRPPSV